MSHLKINLRFLVLFFSVVSPLTSSGQRAEVVDRIVAVAAGRAITWSAAVTEARCKAFLEGTSPLVGIQSDPSEPENLIPVILQLADHIVLDQARIRSLRQVDWMDSSQDMDRINAKWTELVASYGSDTKLREELIRYGLDEQSLRLRFAREQRNLAFVEFSLRPQVRIATEQIQAYYRDEFLPQLGTTEQSAEGPVLDEVRSQIEEILVQREINRLLDPWLESLRKEFGVRLLESPEN